MSEKTRLTVRVDTNSLAGAKRYAEQHGTSLSSMISHFLGQLATAQPPLLQTPILRKLAGVLPAEASLDEHRAHLVDKYGA